MVFVSIDENGRPIPHGKTEKKNMNNIDKKYTELLQDILDNGIEKKRQNRYWYNLSIRKTNPSQNE